MRRPTLTVVFPRVGNIIFPLVKKFLDFSDYKYQKSLISRLDCVQEFQIVSMLNKNKVQNYLEENVKILCANTKYDPEVLELVGTHDDGSYVTTKHSCVRSLWISIGIGNHFEFEQDLFNRGNIVYGFDAQIGHLPKQSKGIRMTRKNWGLQNSDSSMTLAAMIAAASIGENQDWNLKFDIEGAEWKLLNQIFSLENLPRVIACELHNLLPKLNDHDLDLRVSILTKLNSLYEPIFVKPNNYSAYVLSEGVGIYDVLEVTWILRSKAIEMSKTEAIEKSQLVVINDKHSPMFPIGFVALN